MIEETITDVEVLDIDAVEIDTTEAVSEVTE